MNRRAARGAFVVGLTLTVGVGTGCTEDAPKPHPLPAPKTAGQAPSSQPTTAALKPAAASQPSAAATARGAPSAAAPKAISKYRKGDKVVYRYSGTFSQKPVTLTQEVMSVTAGNVLELKMTAERGTAKRRWIQVVTDTPQNQRSNLIDALFELDEHGQKKKLENIRKELFRLYEWTLPIPMDQPPENTKKSKEKVDIAGTEYICEVERGQNTVGGKKVVYAFRQCPGFLWTKGPSDLMSSSGTAIWKVDVLSSTRLP